MPVAGEVMDNVAVPEEPDERDRDGFESVHVYPTGHADVVRLNDSTPQYWPFWFVTVTV